MSNPKEFSCKKVSYPSDNSAKLLSLISLTIPVSGIMTPFGVPVVPEVYKI